MKQKPAKPVPNIAKEIKANKIFPVYLLCGEEHFLSEGTLKQMLEHLLPAETRDFNLTFLEGNEVTTRELLSQVDLYPVMSKWRVVVVRDAPFFKTQQKTPPIARLRNAAKLETANPQKCIATMEKLLEVSAQRIADEDFEFKNAVETLTSELSNQLTDADRGFLSRLPAIAEQVDTSIAETGGGDDIDLLLEWLQADLPKHSVLIFIVRGTVPANNRVAKAIDKVGRYRSFDPVKEGNALQSDPLYKKVTEKLNALNKKITPGAFAQLRNRTGGDMYTIAEAINKIVNFVGDKRQIDEMDIRNIVTQQTFDTIFDLTDAIGKRAIGKALKSLYEVLDSGQQPILVNSTIARQFRLALQAKFIVEKQELRPTQLRMSFPRFRDNVFPSLAAELGDLFPKTASHNILKQNPYVAYKIFQTLNAFTVDELVSAIERTLDVDIQLKTSSANERAILEQLICELCAPKNRGASHN